MSHELRTPLNVMLGLAEMARDPSFDARERDDLLERLGRSGARLLELVEGTLEIGRLETGRSRIDARPVPIAELWRDLRTHCSDLLPRPGVTLEWSEAATEGVLRTDPRKLHVVLRNLVSNALKFTDEGHVRISLEGDARAIVLRVSDTGVGIPPEEHELVFELFRQADGSETRRFDGCGLGLYIVKQFVQLLGGTVELTSAAGAGATFTVTLPREPRAEASDRPGHAPPVASPAPARSAPAAPAGRNGSAAEPPRIAVAVAGRSTGFAT
jgi:signal transduction histidine kinase